MKKDFDNRPRGETENKQDFSFASGMNLAYIEELYANYKADHNSVEPSWQQFFTGYELALTQFHKKKGSKGSEQSSDAAKVEAFVNAYRRLGHLSAHINPIEPKPEIRPFLTPDALDVGHIKDSDRFLPANLPGNKEMSFGEIYQLLKDTYCNHIGAEIRIVNNIDIVTWFQEKMESCRNQPTYDKKFKKHILSKLAEAEGFEKFLQARYLGQKRFSLEGLESLIPMLDIMCNDAKKLGVEEVDIGMAHRGRLNVLTNIMGKKKEQMLKEFEDSEFEAFDIDGDVKYHKGFANNIPTYENGDMRVYLSPNPSHLEMVNPVVEGFTHCRQRMFDDKDRTRFLPVLLHGDAAFIGQGITAETLNLSRLDAYSTGGTIHIITNNQLGFTTDPKDSRSTAYSSAIAKIISAPVLHINADAPEACVWGMQMAVEFRQKFGRDIVLDLVGYRRHGHNETDEPGFTQPQLYKKINKHPTVFTLYSEALIKEGAIDASEVKSMTKGIRKILQDAQDKIRDKSKSSKINHTVPKELERSVTYVKVGRKEIDTPAKTKITAKLIKEIVTAITKTPSDFTPHAKITRLLETRKSMLDGDGSFDWAMGELLAFGSLATEGHHVRLSGQDCQRGTFSSRHAVLVDSENNSKYESLNHISKDQSHVHIINSPLSELGVLGFEFGYSVADPESLVLWEAQFGDFANGAQIIIDQFIAASEAKWKQMCGLVMLLPHGYEGMGPEHSSARLERFLQLCGNLNMQVANPTTPAQYFHILRRQMHRKFRKPLVLMTPKSLLRHPEAISTTDEFTKGQFDEVLEDPSITDNKKVKQAILCSGKIYYELKAIRNENPEPLNIPIIRLEQLYPFPKKKTLAALEKYPNLEAIHWTQEEPQNMGAWNFARPRIEAITDKRYKLLYFGRKNSGTTAEGSHKAHVTEQRRIICSALGLSCSLGSNRDDNDD